MPTNEFGAELINGYIVINSNWNYLGTARVIIAVLPDVSEFVTATAGKMGVTEWNNGHYFKEMERAFVDFKSRSIPGITQKDVDEWFSGMEYAGYPYMGSAENNRHILLADGRIRSIWSNDDGEFIPDDDDVILTVEEWAESFDAWRFDY